jgi:hypothetical protein
LFFLLFTKKLAYFVKKMKLNFSKKVYFLFFIIVSWSCKKEPPPSKNIPDYQEAILVLNEGNFMSGNSSLSMITQLKDVQEDVFKASNGFGLGDVGQSLYFFKDHIYLVVNNSNKIFKLDLNFKLTGTISGLTSPRYFLPLNDTIALVTDLYANGVHVIHIPSLTKIQFLPISGWTENMVFYQNKVYIANPYARSLYIVNPETISLEDSIHLGQSFGAVDLVADTLGNLWALCMGNSSLNISPSLVKIRNKTVLQTWQFAASAYPSRLKISTEKSTLFWINEGIFKMSIHDTILPSQPFIEKGNRNFYNLFVHPNGTEIWAADAKDYVQKGDALRFSLSGQLLNSFKVGIIPSFMLQIQK